MGVSERTGRAIRSATDVGAIALFIYAGELRHGTDPLTFPMLYLDTLAPFLLGWLVVATLAGRLSVADRLPGSGAVGAAVTGAAIWLPACLVGLGLRSMALFHGGVPLSFAAVALVGGAATVAAGRLVSTAVLARYMSL